MPKKKKQTLAEARRAAGWNVGPAKPKPKGPAKPKGRRLLGVNVEVVKLSSKETSAQKLNSKEPADPWANRRGLGKDALKMMFGS